MRTKMIFQNYIHLISTIFTFLFLSQNVNAQSVSFTMSSDSVTVGDTVLFTNTSSGFSTVTIFQWDYNDFSCYTLNEVLTPWSRSISCVDSINGNISTQHIFYYPNNFTITLTAGNLSFSKNIFVKNKIFDCIFMGTCAEYVCNGNFERFSTCPVGVYGQANLGNIGGSTLQTNLLNCWEIPVDVNGNRTSPDYFNSCNTSNGVPCNTRGTQISHVNGSTNHGYAGIFTYMDDPGAPLGYRENISVPLLNSLTQGETYYVSFWVSLSDVSNVGSDIALLFTSSRPTPSFTGQIIAVPQIQSSAPITNQAGWTQVSGLYTPSTNNDNWITIGNFHSNANTSISTATRSMACVAVFAPADYEAYYYIDDVSIKQIQPLTLSNNNINTCTNPVTISVPNSSNYASFLWSNGSTSSSISVIATTTPTNYTCLAIDNDGCPYFGNTTVTLLPSISVSLTSLPACSGQNNGSATANASGGTSPYSYYWTPGNLTTQIISNLAVGNYTVTVTDANGCQATALVTITQVPPPIIEGPQTSCNAPQVYLIANCNQSATYTWSAINDDGSSAIVIPTSACQVTIRRDASFSYFSGIITVTCNSNGCASRANYYVQACCLVHPGIVLYDGDNLDDVFPSVSSITNISYTVINGTFTINRNFTFTGGTLEFGPAAKILIQNDAKLTLDGITLKAYCCKMWKGIEVENGGVLTIKNNSIVKDAQYAIQANDGSSVATGDCQFINNYVGIYTPKNGINSINFSVLDNSALKFTCDVSMMTCPNGSSSLIQPYLGQSPLPGKRSLAGIYLNNVTQILIGNQEPLTEANISFLNLSNGIIDSSSQIYVNSCSFENMIADNAYNNLFNILPNPNGSGILSSHFGYLNVNGLGGTYTSESMFAGCKFGIYKKGGGCDITNCKSRPTNNNSLVNTGVYLTGIKSSANISDNNWNCNSKCIWAVNNPGASSGTPIKIERNDLRLSTFFTPGTAIVCSELARGNHTIIENNLITLNRGIKGINLTNVSDCIISSNVINMNYSNNENGIVIRGGDKNLVKCNNIGQSAQIHNSSVGMKFNMTTNNKISCNYTNNQFYGIQFQNGCGGTLLEGNEMHDHSIGLYLSQSPGIGEQRDRGNLWTGTYTSLNNYGAYLNGLATSPGLAALNRIVYDPSGGVNLLTNNNGPSSPPFWFDPATHGNTFDCSNNFDCVHSIAQEQNIGEYEKMIASDSLFFTEFTEQTINQSQKYLFERFKKDTSLITIDTLFRAFFEENLNANIGRFTAIKEAIKKNAVWEGLFATNYALNSANILQHLDSISYLDSLLHADPNNTLLSLWERSMKQHDSCIVGLMTYGASLLAAIQSIQANYKMSIKDANDSINPNGIYEENEQIINDIYLSMNEEGIYNFTENQVNAIYDIAWQCPFLGGPGVFSARVLYSMISDTIFDDDLICIRQGIAPRMKDTENYLENSSIYPNPAKNSATLVYQMSEDSAGELILFNSLGSVEVKYKLDSKQKEFLFDTSRLSNSIYYYSVNVSDEIVSRGKLLLIR